MATAKTKMNKDVSENNMPFIKGSKRKLVDDEIDILVESIQDIEDSDERLAIMTYTLYQIICEIYGISNVKEMIKALGVLKATEAAYTEIMNNLETRIACERWRYPEGRY